MFQVLSTPTLYDSKYLPNIIILVVLYSYNFREFEPKLACKALTFPTVMLVTGGRIMNCGD